MQKEYWKEEDIKPLLKDKAAELGSLPFEAIDWQALKPRIARSLEQGRVGHIGWYAHTEFEEFSKTHHFEGTKVTIRVDYLNNTLVEQGMPDVKRRAYVQGEDEKGEPFHLVLNIV